LNVIATSFPHTRLEPASLPTPRPQIKRLMVNCFRNYRAAEIAPDAAAVVLLGPNGAGKTNLLEALSFLAPGRGLRRARLSDIDHDASSNAEIPPAWAVAADVDLGDEVIRVGTGRDPAAQGERRLIRLDGVPARGQAALGELLAVSWLTPAMDRLFAEGGSGRRRFLDRLVFAFDPAHAGRVNRFDHAVRERARLLKLGDADTLWLAALEETIAATGVAVAAARREMAERLDHACATSTGVFPKARIGVDGPLDRWLDTLPAVDVESRLREQLQFARRAGDTGFDGPQRTDLAVTHIAKGATADRCSTGEQKALLIAIMLAHARLHHAYCGAAPLLLLDEVAAHLDATRRTALFDEVLNLGGQAWFTGTDAPAFAALTGRAAFYHIEDGIITPH
jgi:DNA replication and repair protein RecF